MIVKYLLVALISAAVAVFALQNHGPTTVRFLVWTLEGVSLAGAVLLAFTLGILAVGIPLLIGRLRVGSQARTLRARVSDLEAAAEREQRPRFRAPDDEGRMGSSGEGSNPSARGG